MAGLSSDDGSASGSVEGQRHNTAQAPGGPEDEQALADLEQTHADTDQTLSDADQTSSDSDQFAADQDQLASDRDLASGGNRRAHEFSREIRERNTRRRELSAQARLAEADRRDEVARARDLAALARDRAAEARDLALAEADAATERALGGRALTGGEIVMRAAEQRRRAAELRALAAAQRVAAAEDRRAAAEDDREQAARERRRALSDRQALARQLAIAETDALTGSRTRAAGLTDLEHEVDRARRTGGQLVVAYVDVIGLKALNDSEGHPAGDALLKRVVAQIGHHVRSYDLIIRLGGDEFLCAMSDVSLREARERFREVAAALAAAPGGGAISAGFAELTAGETASELIARADSKLLEARAATQQHR